MQSYIHADIFFFITTIAVVLITLGILAIIFYAVRILRDVNQVSSAVKEGSEEIVDGLRDLHHNIKSNGGQLKSFLKFLAGFFVKTPKRARKHSEE